MNPGAAAIVGGWVLVLVAGVAYWAQLAARAIWRAVGGPRLAHNLGHRIPRGRCRYCVAVGLWQIAASSPSSSTRAPSS